MHAHQMDQASDFKLNTIDLSLSRSLALAIQFPFFICCVMRNSTIDMFSAAAAAALLLLFGVSIFIFGDVRYCLDLNLFRGDCRNLVDRVTIQFIIGCSLALL